ncbi:MAG: hypothetical protein R2822_07895 [Spirosomataceae bacterium]
MSSNFECLGLNKEVVDKYFTGTISRIGGLSIEDVAREVLVRHKVAYPEVPVLTPRLEVGGFYQWKQRGEAHIFNPQTIHLPPTCYQNRGEEGYKIFKKFSKLIDDQTQKALTRGLMRFKKANTFLWKK